MKRKVYQEGRGRPRLHQGSIMMRGHNPFRPDCHCWRSWRAMRSGMTVDRYVELGGRLKDLNNMVRRGFVSIKKAAA